MVFKKNIKKLYTEKLQVTGGIFYLSIQFKTVVQQAQTINMMQTEMSLTFTIRRTSSIQTFLKTRGLCLKQS